ncbi:hypothetical protein OG799_30325 [Micromonospora sp. NBC_00898]|uniref:hypothetical protein n=1 Tax=Micromonospora sp. NBC_00898 TaxID=2975981 RepID=UPI0038676663|nr:hypothetical protein OG799_30325 [Micromonospora sp. NBC_00898]
MPAPVAPAEKRPSALLTVLFWIGVGLAPMAALILLVSDGNGPLRFGAVLAILAVVLIGLSIALRAESGESAGSEHLLDEIEQLRRELRGEIVAAAQRGNHALDQAQRAQESVTALRRRLDTAAAGIAAAAGITAPAADEQAGGRARVPAVETYGEAPGRGRYAAQDAASTSWGQPAADRRDEDEATRRPQPVGRYAAERPAGYGAERPAGYAAERPAGYGAERPAAYGAERPQPGVYGAARAAEPDARPEPAPRQVGVVHHTETVHVTTRHTIVDGADPAAGNRYGGGYAGRWSPAPEERAWGGAESEERSWAGHREQEDDRGWSADDRYRAGQPGARDDRAWSGPGADRDDRPWSGDPADDHRWAGAAQDDHAGAGAPRDDRGWPAGQGGPRDDRSWAGQGGAGDDRSWASSEQPGRAAVAASDDPDGDYWSELRAGDRWASVRDDEHGQEVRVGERRAAVHADGAGTEFRVEDRWASVRRGEPRRDQDRDAEAGWGGGWAEESRPALPVGGMPVPEEWRPPTQRTAQSAGEWRAAEPEPVRYGRPRGEQRYGYPPQDDVPRAGGARSADRWR